MTPLLRRNKTNALDEILSPQRPNFTWKFIQFPGLHNGAMHQKEIMTSGQTNKALFFRQKVQTFHIDIAIRQCFDKPVLEMNHFFIGRLHLSYAYESQDHSFSPRSNKYDVRKSSGPVDPPDLPGWRHPRHV
ncbi:MAG: hypothetical protein ACXWVG_19725, partial [Telluria sp.]